MLRESPCIRRFRRISINVPFLKLQPISDPGSLTLIVHAVESCCAAIQAPGGKKEKVVHG